MPLQIGLPVPSSHSESPPRGSSIPTFAVIPKPQGFAGDPHDDRDHPQNRRKREKVISVFHTARARKSRPRSEIGEIIGGAYSCQIGDAREGREGPLRE